MEENPPKKHFCSAYNTAEIALQEKKTKRSTFHKLITHGKIFPFSIPNESIALSFIIETKPSDLNSLSNTKESYWTENELCNESFSPLSQMYLFLTGLVSMTLKLFLPLYFITSLVILNYLKTPWDQQVELYFNVIIYFTIPCLIIFLHFKLVNSGFYFLAPFLESRVNFTLSRKTGMVTLFKKGNKVRFSHPFIEFDCVLMSAPTPQGHLNYSLMLVHRYHEYSTGVPLHNFVGCNQSVAEYSRVWNMVQRYMDTSQPMPDVLVLEQSRDKDPVTAVHDKKTNRNPRYWRDMTDEQFAETIEKMREQQKNSPSTGPSLNIFIEDPSRS